MITLHNDPPNTFSDDEGDEEAGNILSNSQILIDYHLACLSREISLLSRREVLTGKAKFGILGDGKEVPQLALSKVFQDGDFRSGYYRDQTLLFALQHITPIQFFAQLYANSNPEEEPQSAGRQMNAHFASHSLNNQGGWNDLTRIKNTVADISCTAGQMARAVGLGLASKKYREIAELSHLNQFSNQGNEVTFVTIGDASTSEGVFWEAINAIGVLKIPVVISIWDDGYGISVPTKYQTTKGNISKLLEGFKLDDQGEGFIIERVKGHQYKSLCKTYWQVVERVRKEHIPAIIHVQELTQPQGHSTSGSHERYKSKERLVWEKAYDCNLQMREWIIKKGFATATELDDIKKKAVKEARIARRTAWEAFNEPLKKEIQELSIICNRLYQQVINKEVVRLAQKDLQGALYPTRREICSTARQLLFQLKDEPLAVKSELIQWKKQYELRFRQHYGSHLHSQSVESPLKVPHIPAEYTPHPPLKNGFEVLNACFDAALSRDPRIFAFGEDLGKIGDVNQGFAGLQSKYGEHRVFDVGIRENTIIGQGIGMAMRGLRPIAEIQYLDYFLYGLQPVSDDLASLHYRSAGRQKAPLIIRTRGHRLEGIWHTGSPLGMLINAVRGVHLLVPRNMTQAAGFYNTLLQGDDPAIVVECLNGYRLKERLPSNIGEFTVPLGLPEIIQSGEDITIITYGSCVRIAHKACKQLSEMDIECELIDVQSLLPFDSHHLLLQSIKKTNRVLFLDEDVPGGATAFMMQEVLEKQGAYYYLDAVPQTLTASAHRSPYGSDGDYFTKPSVDDVIETVYRIMQEADPQLYPPCF